jgi:hypothetical protein
MFVDSRKTVERFIRATKEGMPDSVMSVRIAAALALTIMLAACSPAANPTPASPAPAVPQATQGPPPTRSELLLGEYGRYRANNDLLYYHLDVRLDPDKRFLSGKNTIRFRMLSDDDRIQIDLHQALNVDRILLAGAPLKYKGRVADHSADDRRMEDDAVAVEEGRVRGRDRSLFRERHQAVENL